MKLVIATKNKNKFYEIKIKLAGIDPLELIPLYDFRNSPDVIEDGITFEENALKKAGEIARFTNIPSLADDSGLAVDALNGRPGVLSARYGGTGLNDEERNNLLISELEGIPLEKRNAKFVCVIAIAIPGDRHFLTRGECDGYIGFESKGTHGFGYDPVFILPAYGITMAELGIEEKNRISHRALALDKAGDLIRGLAGGKSH